MNTKPKYQPNFHYEISFPDFEPSEAIRADVEKYLAKLEKLNDRIISCFVSIRAPHMHQRKHIYHVNIHLEIPGEDIIVSHEPEKDFAHSDMHVAIRDAFLAVRRQLRKTMKKRQTKRKMVLPETHEVEVEAEFI